MKNILLIQLFAISPFLSIYSQDLQRLPSLSTEATIGNSFVRIKDGINTSELYMRNVRAAFFLAQIKKISPNFYLSLLTFETSHANYECGSWLRSISFNNINGNNCLINSNRQINFSTGGPLLKYLFSFEDFVLFSTFYLGFGNYSKNGYLLNVQNQKIYTASFSTGIQYPIYVSKDKQSIWNFMAELFASQRSVTTGAMFSNSGLDVSEVGLRIGFNMGIIFENGKKK